MSRITREKMRHQILAGDTTADRLDRVMALIDQREAEHEIETAMERHHEQQRAYSEGYQACESELKSEYQALVDAAGKLIANWEFFHTELTPQATKLREEYYKLCPPPDPHKELAERLTDALFNVGDEAHYACTRIEFKSGENVDTEVSLGGFCKSALASFLEKEIAAEFEKLGDNHE